MTTTQLRFELPASLEADAPPEARGVARDEVRLMVAHGTASDLVHTRFLELPAFLEGGDLIVVNASATIPAAISASGTDGARLVVHLSTHLDDGSWVVEPRRRSASKHPSSTLSSPPSTTGNPPLSRISPTRSACWVATA